MLRVALGGFGGVGRKLAADLHRGAIPGLVLTAVSAQDLPRARSYCDENNLETAVVQSSELSDHADVVVECATFESFRMVVEPALAAGKHVIAISVAALADNLDLIDLARDCGGKLQIANGALPGLDIIRCAAEGNIESVVLTSHMRPDSLAREPYVIKRGLELNEELSEAVHIFSGTAREAAATFPRHFNVGVTLSLAGIGLDRTQIDIYAAPGLPGARHTVTVESDLINLELTAQNFPSVENNRTSRIVAPSILAALRSLRSPLRVGA